MSKVLTIAVAILFVVSFASTSFADAQEVTKGMGHKLYRGIGNVSTGWVELPKAIYNVGKENPLLGLTWGPIKGSFKTVHRTAVGGIETGTFLFPVPNNYNEPLIQPEFAF